MHLATVQLHTFKTRAATRMRVEPMQLYLLTERRRSTDPRSHQFRNVSNTWPHLHVETHVPMCCTQTISHTIARRVSPRRDRSASCSSRGPPLHRGPRWRGGALPQSLSGAPFPFSRDNRDAHCMHTCRDETSQANPPTTASPAAPTHPHIHTIHARRKRQHQATPRPDLDSRIDQPTNPWISHRLRTLPFDGVPAEHDDRHTFANRLMIVLCKERPDPSSIFPPLLQSGQPHPAHPRSDPACRQSSHGSSSLSGGCETQQQDRVLLQCP